MWRALGASAHGVVDYAFVLILAVGPTVAGFAGPQKTFCHALAVVHFLVTIITRFPLGVLKTLPFPVHGALEAVVAIFLVALPWVANFAAGVRSRNFFLLIGLLLGVTWLVTDYRGRRISASPRD